MAPGNLKRRGWTYSGSDEVASGRGQVREGADLFGSGASETSKVPLPLGGSLPDRTASLVGQGEKAGGILPPGSMELDCPARSGARAGDAISVSHTYNCGFMFTGSKMLE
jgi:hypothetical protein